jgi:hypothetical protein
MNECTGSGSGSFWGELGDRIVCILTYGGNEVDCRINYTLAAVSLVACGSLQCILHQRQRQRQRQRQLQQLQQLQEKQESLPRDTIPTEPLEESAKAERTSLQHDSGSLLLPREHNNENTDSQDTASLSPPPSKRAVIGIPTLRSALASLGFAVTLQIGLCLGLECSGISIVWCAMAGWMVRAIAKENGCGSATRDSPLFGWWWNDDTFNHANHGSCGKLVVHLALFSDTAGIVYYAVTAKAITTVAHVCALLMGATLYSLSVCGRNHAPIDIETQTT